MAEKTSAPLSSPGDELDIPGQRGRRLTLIIGAILVIAAVAAITTMIGIGPFGYRLFKYGTMRLYVYNGTRHFVELEIDGSTHEVKPYAGQTIELVGGQLAIDTTLHLVEDDPVTGKPIVTDKREHLETLPFAAEGGHWLYHVAVPESTCLGIADMSTYYDHSSGGRPEVRGLVPKDNRLQPLDVEEVYYPQDILPDQAEPPVIMLGVVACELLDNPELVLARIQLQAEKMRELLERKRAAVEQQRQSAP